LDEDNISPGALLEAMIDDVCLTKEKKE